MTIASALVALFIFAVEQAIMLRKAHSTFENYADFRGCVQLLDRMENSGTCKTAAGETVKIVKYQDKWYLDGDLPSCFFKVCL